LFVNIIDSDKEREDLTRLTRYRVSKTEIWKVPYYYQSNKIDLLWVALLLSNPPLLTVSTNSLMLRWQEKGGFSPAPSIFKFRITLSDEE
jgi:hypothetical protein